LENTAIYFIESMTFHLVSSQAICGESFKIGECPIQNGGPASGGPNGTVSPGGMHFNGAGRQLTVKKRSF
jgi:hypothetical protein